MRRPVKAKARLESIDERATSDEWRKLGYIELKIMQANHDGFPDRWYAAKGLGIRAFWCEWKAEGKDPERHQLLRHIELHEQGEIVIVAHNRREFWDQVRQMQKDQRL